MCFFWGAVVVVLEGPGPVADVSDMIIYQTGGTRTRTVGPRFEAVEPSGGMVRN